MVLVAAIIITPRGASEAQRASESDNSLALA